MNEKKFSQALVKAVGDKNLVGWASYKSVDRHGELVLPSAFAKTAERYLKNPLFLLGHDASGAPSGGLPIGSVKSLSIQDEGVQFEADFASTPVAEMVHGLYRDGHMRAFSIGFYVRGERKPSDDEVKEFGGELRNVITDLELIEISAVPAPACREALAIGVKSLEGKTFKTTAEAVKSSIKSFMERVVSMKKKLSPEQMPLVEALVTAYNAAGEAMKPVSEAVAKLQAIAGGASDEAPEGVVAAARSALDAGTAKMNAIDAALTALEEALGTGEGEDEPEETPPAEGEEVPEEMPEEEAGKILDALKS
jgi:HK97 family phage prohead protease